MDFNTMSFRQSLADIQRDKPADIELLRKEAEIGKREAFEHYLAAVADVPPEDNDLLEN